jgi:hypothetical protein
VVEKNDGESLSDSPIGYFPSLPASQTILNFTDFTPDLAGIEARVALNGSTYGEYADIEVDSRGRAMVLVSSAATTVTKVQFRKKETTTTYAGPVKQISISEQALSVGDYYEGGIVAYFYTSADTGYVSGQVHGLLAANSDSTTSTEGIKWSDDKTVAIGTEVTIGTGSTNTDTIIDAQGTTSSSYAAGKAHAYDGGEYTDWFLPSWKELLKLRDNRILIGNFITTTNSTYWSSSESTQSNYPAASTTHGVLFDGKTNDWVYYKTDALYVRAVRSF